MYKQLTIDHCLYSLDDALSTVALNSLDSYAALSHFWAMLNEEELNLLYHSNKVMAYASDFYILNYLKKDAKIIQFKKLHGLTSKTSYILAYYLSIEIQKWIYNVLAQFPESSSLSVSNTDRDYYLLHKFENVLHDETHILYKQHKIVTHLLTSDFNTTNNYNHAIDTTLQKVRHYLKVNPILQK